MKIKEAINLAIRMGYERGYSVNCTTERPYEHDLLRYTFWMYLGKGLGWLDDTSPSPLDSQYVITEGSWKYFWHKFIDHLALGLNPEDFFEQFNYEQVSTH